MIHLSDEARQRMQDYLGTGEAADAWGIRVVASPG